MMELQTDTASTDRQPRPQYRVVDSRAPTRQLSPAYTTSYHTRDGYQPPTVRASGADYFFRARASRSIVSTFDQQVL